MEDQGHIRKCSYWNDESQCDCGLAEYLRMESEIIQLRADLATAKSLLKLAYCQKVGSDAIHGLDICDNFLEWKQRLEDARAIPTKEPDAAMPNANAEDFDAHLSAEVRP